MGGNPFCIIIPHFNDKARLRRCLDALSAQDPTGVDVVIVDNGSDGGIADVAGDYPSFRFLTEPEAGAAPARNRGVRETDAPNLIFIDADCVPAPGWLHAAKRACRTGVVSGGAVTVFDETEPPRSGAEAFETVFAFNMERYVREEGFAGSGNMATTREIFDAAGPFRAGRSEDVDWSRRAVAGGAVLVYVPEMTASHPTRSDWAALRRKWARMSAELYGLHRAGGGSRAVWLLRAVLMPFSAVAHAPKLWSHPALTCRERLAGMGTLFRLRAQRMVWMVSQAVRDRPEIPDPPGADRKG